MKKIIAAIDPGANGGIAWQTSGRKSESCRMPATEGDIIRLFRTLKGATWHLENLVKFNGNRMPGSAMATYASNWGFLKGAIQMQGDVLHLITPQKWQKHLGLGARKRNSSKTVWKNKLKSEAQRRNPHLDVTLATADALLILACAKTFKL